MQLDLFGIRRRTEALKSALKREIAREMQPESQSYLQEWDERQATEGRNPGVTYTNLEEIYGKESWVRAGIDAIQRTATSNKYRLVPTEGSKDISSLNKEELGSIYHLLERPNPDDTLMDIIAEIIIDLHIYGDAYVEIVKDKSGVPKALYNIYVPSIRVKVDEHGKVLGYIQKPFGSWQSKSSFVEFEADEIAHFRLPNPGNEVYGLSPLESLIVPVETDLYAQAYNKNFFKNHATPRLHVDLGNCTLGQLKRVREYFRSQFQGTKNAHKTIVTEGGAKIDTIGVHPKDMEFLSLRKFNRDEICAVLGVPPMKLGIFEDVNRASALESDKTFKSDKVIPLQRLIASKINNSILSQFGEISEEVEFEFVEVDLRDAKEQAEIDKTDIDSGVLTVNEIRRNRGLPPLPSS